MVAGVVAVVAESHDAPRRSHGALARGQYRADQQDLGFQPGRAAQQRGEGMEYGYNGIGQGEHVWTFREKWGPASLPCSYNLSSFCAKSSYSYHAFITDREGDTPALEADHRRHAEVENAIHDLKYGVGLNHLPSGRFPANGAWLAVQVMAHNLARWTTRIGLGEPVATTKTLRRRFFSLAGRLTRKARRLTLHLPQGWPWQNQFSSTLARLRALPLSS